MSNVLYFISEIPSLYVFVWEGGSSWHNHLPKCAKIHFSKFQILKFSRGKVPAPPMGGCHPPTHTLLPPTASAVRGRRWSALLHCSGGYSISFSFYFKIWGEPWDSSIIFKGSTWKGEVGLHIVPLSSMELNTHNKWRISVVNKSLIISLCFCLYLFPRIVWSILVKGSVNEKTKKNCFHQESKIDRFL